MLATPMKKPMPGSGYLVLMVHISEGIEGESDKF